MRWFHGDGNECPHKRCKRRTRVLVLCDRCKVREFTDTPAGMYEEAKRRGFILRTTGAVWCPQCFKRRSGDGEVPLPQVVQMELFPDLES